MNTNSNDFDHTTDAVVDQKFLERTRQLNIEQRQIKRTSLADKFFEKTSALGVVAFQLPIFLVKEFSLARINGYLSILFFGSTGFWATTAIKANKGNFFMMFFPIIVVLFSIVMIVKAIIDISTVYDAVKRVKADVGNKFKTVPLFIIRTYRSLICKVIDIHWVSILFYIIGGLWVLLPTLLNNKTIPYTIITFKFEDIDNPWGVYAILKYALIGTALFQTFYTIWVKTRLKTIINFYGYEIVPFQEQLEIKKTRNAMWRRGVIYTIFILGFVFVLIHRFIQRRKVLK